MCFEPGTFLMHKETVESFKLLKKLLLRKFRTLQSNTIMSK